MKRFLFSLIVIAAAVFSVFPDNVRGEVVDYITIASDEKYSIVLNLENLLGITVDPAYPFLDGIEIAVKIPSAIRKYRSSFALRLFSGITPDPAANIKQYTGEEVDLIVLPDISRLYIQIPYLTALTEQPNTLLVDSIFTQDDFPVVVSFLPIMKGIPDSVYYTDIEIDINPIISDKGGLQISLSGDVIDTDRIQFNIDKSPIPLPVDNPFILNSGIYEINLEAEGYERLSRTIVVEPGKINNIDLIIQKAVSEVSFDAPESVEVFLDGEFVADKNTPFEIEEGEHTVVFTIGTYSMSKKFIAERGKSLKISLFLDIIVNTD